MIVTLSFPFNDGPLTIAEMSEFVNCSGVCTKGLLRIL